VIDVSPAEDHSWYSQHLHERRLLAAFGDDHRARMVLLDTLRRAVQQGGETKEIYKRAVSNLIEQHRTATQARKAHRAAHLKTILDTLRSDPKAAVDLVRNQQAWCALPREEREAIARGRAEVYERERRRARMVEQLRICGQCFAPIWFPESKAAGRCYRCRGAAQPAPVPVRTCNTYRDTEVRGGANGFRS
jgi:hypothetical protein